MDLFALNLRSGGGVGHLWAGKRKEVVVRQSSCSRRVIGGEDCGSGFGGVVEIVGVSARKKGRRSSFGYRSLEVRAAGKKNNDENSSSSGKDDPSTPEGHDFESSNSAFDETKSENSHRPNLDWRTFRAILVRQELMLVEDSDRGTDEEASLEASRRIGIKWAHPIAMPETGCVLVATEKLDGVRNFERAVILLLRLGTRDPREGPFGVIINRPLHKKIRQMKPTNPDLVTTFAHCSLHFGGPLDASMFLLRTNESSPLVSFEQVLPGICFGARNSLNEAAGLIKSGIARPRDFRFFVGYAGWQLDQLREEIASGYWVVAACSSDLIACSSTDSSSYLWEEILQLMGGRYSELSRKPRQDSS